MKPYLPSIITGVLLASTLPWFNFSFFAWIALVPFFLFLSHTETSYRQAFQGGLVSGLIYFSTVVYPLFSLKAWWWIDIKGVVYENKFLLLFWIIYGAVLIASILFGLFAVIFKKFCKENLVSTIILAIIWVFFEYIHAKILFGFTWGHLGYSLHEFLPLLQLARYGDVYSLSFLIVFVNILLYCAIHHTLKKNRVDKKSLTFLSSLLREPYLYIAIIIVSIATFWGHTILIKQPSNKNLIPVVILQPGDQSTSKNEGAVLSMVRQSLINNPAIVIVSESAFFPVIIDEDSIKLPGALISQGKGSYSTLLQISKDHPGTSFVVGADTQRNSNRYNSILVIERGEITGIYHKRILFPFSERPVSWLRIKTIEPLTQGGDNGAIAVRGKQVSALICSEVLSPGLANDPQTDLIIAIGNDGVFQNPLVAEYNNIIARFVAITTKKYLVRAMKTGVSSIVTPSGDTMERSTSSGPEFILGAIPN